MKRSTLEELAQDPVGRWVAGESWAHFCAAPNLWGIILWGRPDEAEAFRLGRSLVLELRPPAQPHASLIDTSRLEGADPTAFRAAGTFLTNFADKLTKMVTRVALVRPGGIDGAIVAGAYDVLPKPYPVAVFTEIDAAMVWLAQDGAPGKNNWPDPDVVARIHEQASGTPPIVGALRAYLDGAVGSADLHTACAALAVSERTLQRKLGEAGTTFHDELTEARIRAAKRLLTDGDAPLTTIAFEVGCASLQHFSTLFKKHTGETPSAFRQRARGTA